MNYCYTAIKFYGGLLLCSYCVILMFEWCFDVGGFDMGATTTQLLTTATQLLITAMQLLTTAAQAITTAMQLLDSVGSATRK